MSRGITEILDEPSRALTPLQRRFLKPLGPVGRVTRGVLERINRRAVPRAFQFSTTGRAHLPRQGPFILAPNHSSSLDSFLLAAALPRSTLAQTRWAGKREALLRNRLFRYINRLARAVPVPTSSRALAVGAAVLRAEGVLVWFPEGRRTRDGELQKLKPGIGLLAAHFDVPVVPVWIEGAFAAWPPSDWFPRFGRRIDVSFGPPLRGVRTGGEDASAESQSEARQIVQALRHGLVQLRDDARDRLAASG